MKILTNFHVIEARYYGPTNHRGSRVILTSHRFEDSLNIGFDYESGYADATAQKWLEKNGFHIVGKAESKNGYFFICSTFKGLKR